MFESPQKLCGMGVIFMNYALNAPSNARHQTPLVTTSGLGPSSTRPQQLTRPQARNYHAEGSRGGGGHWPWHWQRDCHPQWIISQLLRMLQKSMTYQTRSEFHKEPLFELIKVIWRTLTSSKFAEFCKELSANATAVVTLWEKIKNVNKCLKIYNF